MTTTLARATRRTLAVAAVLAGTTACSDFLNVHNPNVIDINALDPSKDAAALANSAQQNFATAVGTYIQFSSHFTGETYIMETSGAQNEFGRREVSDLNGQSTTQWREMSLAAASAKLLLDLTLPNPTTNIHIARAATFRAYAMLFMATDFCTGTLAMSAVVSGATIIDSPSPKTRLPGSRSVR